MSKPWEYIERKIEDLRLTIDPKNELVKQLREVIHGEALRLSIDLQYAKRYEKAELQGEYNAYRRVWQMLGGDQPEEPEQK